MREKKAVLWAAWLGCFFATTALACDTPVYRYAMYRWQPAPYELYFFRGDKTDDARAAQHDQLRELPYAKQAGNLAVIDVDLNDSQAFARLPASIRERWDGSKQSESGYLVFSPHGNLVWSGSLSLEELKQIPQSPMRQKIASELGNGKLGVLLMLAADESSEGGAEEEAAAAKAANQNAETAIAEALATIRKGDADLYGFDGEGEPNKPSDPKADEPIEPAQPSAKPAKDQASVAGEAPEVAWLRVDRTDPNEAWLVRTLLAVEEDLGEPQFRRQPMVFVLYGRGRALPPFVGKGIRAQNLVGDIQFISGACSCTVKDQNPGVDLMMQHDWESASKLLAAKFGSEEGNETQLGVGEYFPSLSIPPAGEETTPTITETADERPLARDGNQDDREPALAESRRTEGEDDNQLAMSEGAGSHEDGHSESHGDVGSAAHGNDSPRTMMGSEAARVSFWLVGAVTSLALIGLLGATFLLLRSN